MKKGLCILLVFAVIFRLAEKIAGVGGYGGVVHIEYAHDVLSAHHHLLS